MSLGGFEPLQYGLVSSRVHIQQVSYRGSQVARGSNGISVVRVKELSEFTYILNDVGSLIVL